MIFIEMKENLQIFYARYSAWVNAAVKFSCAFLFMFFLRQRLGFFDFFNGIPVMAVISVLCAALPYGAICFIMAVILLAHVYELSFETALIAAAVLFMTGLVYFAFQPRNAYWLLLTPLAFYFRIPYVIPLLAGFSGTLSGLFPACCGVVVYYLVNYVSLNAAAITGDISTDIIEKCMQMIQALVTDKEMICFAAAFAIGLITVYLIRTLSVDYAWAIALAIGVLSQIVVLFLGDVMFDVSISVMGLIAGMVVSVLITVVYILFVFMVDYSRTEKLQFQDDDYVYYVKAVPRIAAGRHRSSYGRGDTGRPRR